MAPETRPAVVFHTAVGEIRVRVEIVATERARSRGLMHREHLAEDQGMLFVFPTTFLHSFWMKNTLIPLDIIFIGPDRRVVGVVADAAPLTLDGRRVTRPSRWVVEVNGGFALRYGITAGTPVELPVGLPTGS